MITHTLSTPKAAARAGVSRFVLMRAQKSNEIHAVKDNKGRWVWNPDDIDAWAKERPDTAPKAAQEGKDTQSLTLALGRAEGRAEGLEIALESSKEEVERWRTLAEQERARADALASRRWVFPWRR